MMGNMTKGIEMDTTLECLCDLDFVCEDHINPPAEWSAVLGIRPAPFDAWDAYEGTYKGRYFEGWDAA